MPLVRIAGLLAVVLTTGCACTDLAREGKTPGAAAMEGKPPAPAPKPAAAKPETVVVPTTKPAVAVEPVAPPPPVAVAPSPDHAAAKPAAPAAKPAAREPAPPASKKEVAAAPAPRPAAPTLDLASLEKRLRETNAIGVFTKLTLKNQVDALLEQFRAHYQGRIKTTLAQLRQPYDQLLLKVLSLLQDSDPPLAREISQSREAIWGILSDPNKFNNL